MVKINYTDSKGNEYGYYMDNRLKRDLDTKVKTSLNQKGEDYVLVIDGRERWGKTTLGIQIGKYLDHDLDLNRICFSANEFRKAIVNAKPKSCVIYDEAYRGLGSASALSEVNRILKGMMMEMGSKNLFVIIILPTFYLLEKYVALWRARALIHIPKKSYWRLYNTKLKQKLYLDIRGKRGYTYGHVRTRYRGRFYKGYLINEDEYNKKKTESFIRSYKTTKQEKYKEQRNKFIWILYKEAKFNILKLEKLCKEYGIRLRKSTISDILGGFKVTGG